MNPFAPPADIRFQYSCFDRMLLNAVVQPMQQAGYDHRLPRQVQARPVGQQGLRGRAREAAARADTSAAALRATGVPAGALGLSDDYRNGFERVRVTFKVEGDASAEKLRELIQRAQQRSAVFVLLKPLVH